MPGGDVDQPRSAHARIVDLHPLLIHPDGRDLRAACPECGGCPRIPRILHAHPISGIDKEPHREIECFLHTRDDGNLVGGALHSAGSVQVAGDCLAQRRISQRTAAEQKTRRDPP